MNLILAGGFVVAIIAISQLGAGHKVEGIAINGNATQVLISETAKIELLANNLSRIAPYNSTNNVCWNFVERFIGNATKLGYTCRSIKGAALWAGTSHNWAECNTTSGLLEIEATPSIDGNTQGHILNSIEYLQYVPQCKEPWNQTRLDECLFVGLIGENNPNCTQEEGVWICQR